MSTPVHEEGDHRFAGPGPDRLYREALQAGEFRIQRCRSCSRHVFYPRVICPGCGGATLDWVTASRRATVYATTVIRRRKEQGGDYNVAIVELDEGPRLMTRIDGIDPAAVTIGLRVEARLKAGETGTLLVFVPRAGPA